MSGLVIEIIIGCVTFVTSVSTSMFIAGSRWGEVRADVKTISERLAKIEGMFTLKLEDRSA